jgi:aminomethyltransferase
MSETRELKKTPLYEEHVRLGGKIVDFAGWLMPIQYAEGILKEHETVRTGCGVFDVSHMGEIWVTGDETLKFCENLIPTSVAPMKFGEICYSCFCNEEGGIVDDLLLYKIEEKRVLIVINASNIEKDFTWVQKRSEGYKVNVENASCQFAQIALQGPEAEKIIQPYSSIVLSEIPFYHFAKGRINGIEGIISRTGYTGEDGFEFYISPDASIPLWRKLIELGAKPAGLGARDTLRFEACYMLYGNEITDTTTPVEAGLKWIIDFQKEFYGREAIIKKTEAPNRRRLKGFEVMEKGGIPRHGAKIFSQGEEIGNVTTGNKSPSTGRIVFLAYVPETFKNGDMVEAEVKPGKHVKAKVVKTPFFRGSVKTKKK